MEERMCVESAMRKRVRMTESNASGCGGMSVCDVPSVASERER